MFSARFPRSQGREHQRAPLIQHGTNDSRVPFSESVAPIQVLCVGGIVTELVAFEDECHAT